MSFLRTHIFKHYKAGTAMPNTDTSSSNSVKILIVEDNPINRKIMTLFLEELGYHNLIIAETGNKALAIFDPSIDLVLLDIGLPDITGLEVCKQMRKLLQGKALPILAVTALSDDEMNNACQAAGIDKIVLKPLSLDMLNAQLKQWLSC